MISQADGRLFGIADPGSCGDLEATARELRWAAAHGFVGVMPPGHVLDPSLPPMWSDYYEPFWSACHELGLNLTIHAGYGFPQGMASGMSAMGAMVAAGGTEDLLSMSTLSTDEMGAMRIDEFPRDHGFRTALAQPRRLFWQLMLAGSARPLPLAAIGLHRDPHRLGARHARRGGGVRARPRRPAATDRPRVLGRSRVDRPVVDASARSGDAPRDRRGADPLGADYPHPEGTWPNTKQWIRHAFAGVPEGEARAILGSTPIHSTASTTLGWKRRRSGSDRSRVVARDERWTSGCSPSSTIAPGICVRRSTSITTTRSR